MIGIGDFARLGRVSVRMLRHYDAIGLLRPDQVDLSTGYRHYDVAQLRRLNRIVALKDLGLRLEQIGPVVDEQVSADDLRSMLRLRQAELEAQIADSEHRLRRVRARLRLIDMEDTVSDQHITVTTTAPATGLGRSAVAASATHEDIGPVVGPLFADVLGRLSAADLRPTGPAVAYYEPAPEVSEDALSVRVLFPVGADAAAGLDRIELPGATVCSAIHRGSMDGIDATYQLLRTWARDNGWTETGGGREIYLEVPADQSEWVTEVQLDITR